MAELRAAQIDPRDASWELRNPAYRVYFWNADASQSREFELAEVEHVGQVMEWANANVLAGEVYTVFAVVTSDELGLVRLSGPNTPC